MRRFETGIRWVILAVLAVVCGALGGEASGQSAGGASVDWPQWRGPGRTGVSSETGWESSWAEGGPRVLWKKSVGAGFSSVAVRAGRLYTMGNTDGTDAVYCLDARSGKELWKHSYACAAGGDDVVGPRATPALDGGSLFTVSRAGHVLCLDAESGKVAWSVHLPGTDELKGNVPRAGLEVSASPLVEGRLLVLNIGPAVVALDKTDGRFVWKDRSAEGGFASPVILEGRGGRCAVIFGGRQLVGLDVRSGRKLWEYPWECTANAADPVVSGETVLISSGYNKGCALLSPAEGAVRVLWQNRTLSSHFSSPVLHEGHVYGFDGNANQQTPLVCVEFATGREKWRQGGLDMGTLIVAGGRLVMLTERGWLVTAEASPRGYTELARAQVLTGRCWTVPVLSGGAVYCRSDQGELVCIDVRKK